LREGIELFPKDRLIANNLAYTLLLHGDVDGARMVLESISRGGPPPQSEGEVALTATWGLLRLLEGNIEEGEQLYQRAETLAAQMGRKDLALRVGQKMNCELARAYARLGDFQAASKRVQRGLLIKDGKKSYRRDLQDLERSLKDGMAELTGGADIDS